MRTSIAVLTLLVLQICRSTSLPTHQRSLVFRVLRRVKGGDAIADIPDDHAPSTILEDILAEAAADDGGGHAAVAQGTDLSHQRRTFLGTALSGIQNSRLKESLQRQLETIKSRASRVNAEQIKQQSTRLMGTLAPATVAFTQLFYRKDGTGLTIPALYSLALVGSSCGFYLFLYFITVGYATGIIVPLLFSLYMNNALSSTPALKLSNLHSGITVLWAIRSAIFFLYREYINWPQLHDKVVEVNKMARLSSKIFCWVVYSFFYVALASPCVFRLEASTAWGVFGKFSIVLQLIGLILEAVADHQKSAFKALPGNRNQWCNVGLWKWSTHPNYLGEMLFWFGTYFGGISCFNKKSHWALSTLGMVFILVVLRGAIISLGQKHFRKYGYNPKFVEFRKTHTLIGPIPGAKSKILRGPA